MHIWIHGPHAASKPWEDNPFISSNQKPKIYNYTMEITMTLLGLRLAIASFASCAATAGSGTHSRGNPKNATPMSGR